MGGPREAGGGGGGGRRGRERRWKGEWGGWEGPGGEAVGDCLLEGVGAIVEGGDNAVPVEEKGVVEWGVEKVVRKVS